MADSFSFNDVDMSAYGLKLRTHGEPFRQETGFSQLQEKAYGLSSRRPPMEIALDVVIKSSDIATLKSYLDSIKTNLNHQEDKKLEIDTFTDRYWMARFAGMEGSIVVANAWEGTITFICYDSLAYSTTEENNDHTVDEDPESFEENPGGTAPVLPVITLSCDDADELVDGFEWGSEGDDLDDSGGDITWTISVAGSSQAEIDTSPKYAGTRSARLYRDGTNNVMAKFSRTALGSQEELTFRHRKDTNAQFLLNHGNGTMMINLRIDTDESIDFYDGSWHDTGSSVTVATWEKLTIRNVDWSAGTFDIYLDDLLIYTGATMETSASYEDEIAFFNLAGTSQVWLDNVRVGWYERTIEINNEETGEILTWTGELRDGEELVVDCSEYTIEMDDEDAISGLEDGSEFPHLLPNQNNTIVVSGFSGNCNLTYRARYL